MNIGRTAAQIICDDEFTRGTIYKDTIYKRYNLQEAQFAKTQFTGGTIYKRHNLQRQNLQEAQFTRNTI
jgi:uncharacterized protein YjbI with pentapeptide repeats